MKKLCKNVKTNLFTDRVLELSTDSLFIITPLVFDFEIS